MPAALALTPERSDQASRDVAAMQAAWLRTGRSTRQAARSFCGKLERAGGFERLGLANKIDVAEKARSFAQWQMVTGQLIVTPQMLGKG